MRLIIYFDYTCPYSYNAATWLREVARSEPELMTEWRPFVVKEVNRLPDEGVPFWEQAAAPHSRTGLAFMAGQAAARQDPAAFDRFRFALQTAFIVQHMDIRQPGVLEAIAADAGLDVGRFMRERQAPELLQEVGQKHQDAVNRYAVFGTPTLVFPVNCPVYLKLAPAPGAAESPRLFALLREAIERYPVIQEIKLTRQEHP